MREYDCRVCVDQKLYQRRKCFKQPWKLNEEKRDVHVGVPVVGKTGKPEFNSKGKLVVTRRVVDEDGFLEILWEMSEIHPHLNSWEVLQLFWKEVCSTAFADEVMGRIIAGEKTINDYKGAVGSIDKEDVRIGIFGFDLGYEGTIEALDITRSAKRSYERWEMEEMDRKAEIKNKQGQGAGKPKKLLHGDS